MLVTMETGYMGWNTLKVQTELWQVAYCTGAPLDLQHKIWSSEAKQNADDWSRSHERSQHDTKPLVCIISDHMLEV